MRRAALFVTLALQATLAAQSTNPNWTAVDAEALNTLQRYIRINTSVPPGDVTKAADLLVGLLEREGIPTKRFESGPGRSIVMARLEGTGPGKAASSSCITWTSCRRMPAAGRAIRSAARSPKDGSGDAARWT